MRRDDSPGWGGRSDASPKPPWNYVSLPRPTNQMFFFLLIARSPGQLCLHQNQASSMMLLEQILPIKSSSQSEMMSGIMSTPDSTCTPPAAQLQAENARLRDLLKYVGVGPDIVENFARQSMLRRMNSAAAPAHRQIKPKIQPPAASTNSDSLGYNASCCSANSSSVSVCAPTPALPTGSLPNHAIHSTARLEGSRCAEGGGKPRFDLFHFSRCRVVLVNC